MATQDGVRLLRVIFGSVCVCAREKGYSYWIGAFYLLPSSHTHTHTHTHAHTRVCVLTLSRVQLFATPWTVTHQALWSMGFSRQEYWSGLPFPSPGDLPNPGIKPGCPTLQADSLLSEPPGKPTIVSTYVNTIRV